MKQIIKIGIQNNDYPIYLEGEITTHQLELVIRLLQVMLNNRKKLKQEINQSLNSGKPELVWKGKIDKETRDL